MIKSIFPDTIKDNGRLINVAIDKIIPNRYQPREVFDETKLYELANSIKENGILQPLTARKTANEKYELIAGERRLRAAKLVGLSTVPVIVKGYSNEQAMIFAIIENIQRHDLNFFEEARSYYKLINECNITQDELAERLGKTQSTVANKLRLLKLDNDTQRMICENNLTERHARSLLKLEDKEQRDYVLKEIISRHLNVAQTEVLIMELLMKSEKEKKIKTASKRRMKIFEDFRIFKSTMNQTIDVIKKSGLKVKSDKNETDDFIEYIIRVCK